MTVASNGSSGYFASPPTSPLTQAVTSKLNAPGTPTAVTSTSTAGAIVITFTAPTGTAPTSYTATACTNNSMTTGCLTGPITSGGTLSGLAQGGSYYVTVTANPPAGFVGATSPVSTNPTGASTQLNLPTITSVLPSTTTAGQLTIGYTGSSNAPVGQTYTAMACTDLAMTPELRLARELRVRIAVHGPDGRLALLRDHHRGVLGELPRGDDRPGRPDPRHRPARDARHADARLRHRRRLDLGHRHHLERPRRASSTRSRPAPTWA